MRRMDGKRKRKTDLTKSRNGSNNPLRLATRDIAVLSPPGMIRAEHCERSEGVRTSMKLNVNWGLECVKDDDDSSWSEADRRSWRCSLKAPCRARTPMVIRIVFSSGTVMATNETVVVGQWGVEDVTEFWKAKWFLRANVIRYRRLNRASSKAKCNHIGDCRAGTNGDATPDRTME